jgi:hypothetical protein
MTDASMKAIQMIAPSILLLRGQRVILDADLASLYGVATRVFNQAVKRNIDRFPLDFMFQLSPEEKSEVITNCDHLTRLKYSPSLPYAFTEHGAVMAATILNSSRAVEVSVYVVRAFVELRSIMTRHEELSHRLTELEGRVGQHDEYIVLLVEAIRQLALPDDSSDRQIGFRED